MCASKDETKLSAPGKKIPCNDDGIWFDNKIYKGIKRMLLSMLLFGKFCGSRNLIKDFFDDPQRGCWKVMKLCGVSLPK